MRVALLQILRPATDRLGIEIEDLEVPLDISQDLTEDDFQKACHLLRLDPSSRHWVDFALNGGLAYLALGAGTRFGVWDLVVDSLKEMVPVFFSIGAYKYQSILINAIASLQEMSAVQADDLSETFSISLKVHTAIGVLTFGFHVADT
jgi:hypothetical protein